MRITCEDRERCALVAVAGQVDSAHGPALERTLDELIELGQRNLVINLRDVTLISSIGLRALVSAYNRVRKMVPQGAVVLSQASPTVVETLQLVGFYDLFCFFDEDAAAIACF